MMYCSQDELTVFSETFPCVKRFILHDYLNVKVPIPCNVEELLETSYTADWRTPDPNWQDENKPNRKEVKGVSAYIRRL